jgi:hypothetical protein
MILKPPSLAAPTQVKEQHRGTGHGETQRPSLQAAVKTASGTRIAEDAKASSQIEEEHEHARRRKQRSIKNEPPVKHAGGDEQAEDAKTHNGAAGIPSAMREVSAYGAS